MSMGLEQMLKINMCLEVCWIATLVPLVYIWHNCLDIFWFTPVQVGSECGPKSKSRLKFLLSWNGSYWGSVMLTALMFSYSYSQRSMQNACYLHQSWVCIVPAECKIKIKWEGVTPLNWSEFGAKEAICFCLKGCNNSSIDPTLAYDQSKILMHKHPCTLWG